MFTAIQVLFDYAAMATHPAKDGRLTPVFRCFDQTNPHAILAIAGNINDGITIERADYVA
jgi:hypothetical protein